VKSFADVVWRNSALWKTCAGLCEVSHMLKDITLRIINFGERRLINVLI
jgi:hypothetical protein